MRQDPGSNPMLDILGITEVQMKQMKSSREEWNAYCILCEYPSATNRS
jgi:hypothetical protein